MTPRLPLLSSSLYSTKTKPLTHYWRLRCRLVERHGQHCRILVKGSLGSILIEFEDGMRYVVSWRSVRELRSTPLFD